MSNEVPLATPEADANNDEMTNEGQISAASAIPAPTAQANAADIGAEQPISAAADLPVPANDANSTEITIEHSMSAVPDLPAPTARPPAGHARTRATLRHVADRGSETARLAQRALSFGLKQADVATLASVSPGSVSRLLLGEPVSPAIRNAILVALDFDPAEFRALGVRTARYQQKTHCARQSKRA